MADAGGFRHLGKPVFPGSSTIDQLQRVMELTGFPSAQEVAAMRSPFAATMLESLPTMPPAAEDRWQQRFPGASADAIDLMRQLLSFDPAGRLVQSRFCLRAPPGSNGRPSC